MRIDSLGRIVSSGGAPRGSSQGGFHIAEDAQTEAPRPATPMRAMSSLETLIALQEVTEDPRERRRKAVTRGRDLLDALDDLKIAMMDGVINSQALAQLSKLAAERGPTGDAGLDDAISAIELRAKVELAKRGQ